MGASLNGDMGIGTPRSLHERMENLESDQCCKGPHQLDMMNECPSLRHTLCYVLMEK